MVSKYLLFHLFPTFYPLPHGPKRTRLNKIHISTGKYSLLEENFSPRRRNNIGHILLYIMDDYPVWLQLSLIIYLPIQDLTWWFHFYWFLCIEKKNVNRERVKGDRQQLTNSKHKVKHKIGCYPKYLLIFTY